MSKLNKDIVAVSGGFDPLHIGHLRMFKEARKYGKKLVVILNNDNWLIDKKGFVFMPQQERKELLLEFADKVVITNHKKGDPDRSVNRELMAVKPAVFCNGGDRTHGNIPEVKQCDTLGIKMVFNIGKGGKVQSSSWLTARFAGLTEQRPWGNFTVLRATPSHWVKRIAVKPGHRLSLQSHEKRDEWWMCVEGDITAEVGNRRHEMVPGVSEFIQRGTAHRMSSVGGGVIVEIALGQPEEADIVRYEDDYGRA